MVGADYDWGRLVTGLSVAYSGGGGEYTVRGTGDLKDRTGDLQSWLLSTHPYASLKLTDRLQVWGLLGYGLGQMSLAEDGGVLETDIELVMGAFGGRGVLLSRVENGAVDLTVKADGFILQVSGEEADGLLAATAEVSRVRLLLEGSVDALRGPAGVLTPSLQVGGRYDGGAAETGAGLEVGGGLSYAYPAWGLTLAANGRLLLAHQDRDYEEWGAGGSLRLAPGAAGRGPSLSFNTSWGDTSSSVEQLWSQGAGPATGLAAEAGTAPAGRLAAELSYGLEVAGGGGVLTPYAGMALADGGARNYRLGGRFTLGPSLSLSPAASRARPDRIRRRSAAFAHLGDAQRCAVRSARTLAAPALLALALPAAAQAQTVTTLVSNIGQRQTTTFGSVAPRAQRFTTGSNAHGYLLSSVEVVSADTSSGRFGVRVCTTDTDGFPTSGFPTSTCPGLTPPRSFAAGTLSFSAPANLVLAQRTTYTVVLLSDAGIIDYGSTLANGQDLGQADGWLIADAYDWADF